MMIKQLGVKGFRSLRKITWEPGALNVVIGPNGSGKSNLLRALDTLSAIAQGHVKKYVQSAGGMGSLVWDGYAPNVALSLSTSPNDGGAEYVTYGIVLSRLGDSTGFTVQSETLRAWLPVEHGPATGPTMRPDPLGFDRSGSTYSVSIHPSGIVEPKQPGTLASVPSDQPLLSTAGILLPSSVATAAFQAELATMTLCQSVDVSRGAAIRQAPVTSYETRVEPDGQNLVQVLHTLYTSETTFEDAIDSAMHAAFANEYVKLLFAPAADQRIQMRLRWKDRRRADPSADLSDGTLRFLFLLAVLASPDPAPLIAIDEPETGLHPTMMRIVAEYAVEAARHTQVIFTTHSAEFLDAFGDARPAVTVCEAVGGETKLRRLDGDALDYWLKDYSLGSLFRSGSLEAMA
jgi:predicted ATPase